MSEPQLSRGDRRLLERLIWIGRNEGRIQRTQKQLGKALGLKRGVPRDVSDSMVRRHLRNLDRWIEVEQGGDGQPACYYFTAALPAEFGSGLSREMFRAEVPGWFRAENLDASPQIPQNTPLAEKKFRAEIPSSSSVEKLKNSDGLDGDDEKSARVTVSPRAACALSNAGPSRPERPVFRSPKLQSLPPRRVKVEGNNTPTPNRR
jgi:hypothetical protein